MNDKAKPSVSQRAVPVAISGYRPAEEEPQIRRDEQTGKLFELVPEDNFDIFCAVVSYLYLLLALGFFLWLLFDTWARKYTFALWLGYSHAETQALLNTPIFRAFAYAFIGGALGGIIAGYRSCMYWHSEERAFGWRFVWKYIFFPWLGATLALFVYAIVAGGIAVLGGVSVATDATTGVTKMLSALAIGSLVGFGSPKVMTWLDSQVNKLFKVDTVPESQVPDASAEKTMWVFGYGSLMWDHWEKDYECSRTVKAKLSDYRRIFNKASKRRWGTKTGRCPTLNIEKASEASVTGIAFEFPSERRAQVLAYLKKREGEGFEFVDVTIKTEDGIPHHAIVPIYRSGEDLIQETSLDRLAEMARGAKGEAGKCLDYVAQLAAKLRELGIEDPIVTRFYQATREPVGTKSQATSDP